ncbi:FAD-dependent oxidoreductase [Thiomicrospira microaerophila]|uniref:FAD-dependent oxidoreductase n=1 Tax=Thiomicrospira microaerophila TaxID=406020 RepID=UPI0005C8323A|nr:FAD-dependent oxidoreductase [Thiomicrospira microaerophila]
MDATDADVLIVGGGPVGLCLALGLAQKNARVTLVEAQEPIEGATQSFDGRVLALSQGSKHILTQLNVWQDLEPFTTDILHVHVSQQGYFGLTLMHAEEMGVEALGYAIKASDLGRVLWRKVHSQSGVEQVCPATLDGFTQTAQEVTAHLSTRDGMKTLRAGLIVGADGTHSQVRKTLGLALEQKSYDAWAILAQVETQKPHQNWAFERFTQEGPVALLPLNTHSHKLVYVASSERYQALLDLSDSAFIAAFRAKMGERFGPYTTISPRVAYPLKETYVNKVVVGRAVLMGNASHTQHPVAAQGLNLGLRDVSAFLAGVDDLTALDNRVRLAAYEQQRQQDHRKVMRLTDGLTQVFEHPSPLVGHARGLAMLGLQVMPNLKKRLARFSMQGANVL